MNDDDDKTQPGSPPQSEEDAAIRAAADALGRAARACEQGLRLVLTVHPDHRGSALRSATLLLGELGDLCHEERSVINKLRNDFYDLR